MPIVTKTILPFAGFALALMLAGCSDTTSDDGATLEEAQAEMAKLDRPEPGQYRQEIAITKLVIAGAPTDMMDEARALMEQATTYCLTREQADEGFEKMYKEVTEKQGCTYDRFEVADGRVAADLSCAPGGNAVMTMTMNGTVSSEGSNVEIAMTSRGGAADMDIAMTLTATRLGDCPEG